MEDEKFKLQVMEYIGEIRANVKTLMDAEQNRPPCENKSIKKDIKINRSLIFLLLTGLVAVFTKGAI